MNVAKPLPFGETVVRAELVGVNHARQETPITLPEMHFALFYRGEVNFRTEKMGKLQV